MPYFTSYVMGYVVETVCPTVQGNNVFLHEDCERNAILYSTEEQAMRVAKRIGATHVRIMPYSTPDIKAARTHCKIKDEKGEPILLKDFQLPTLIEVTK